MVKIHAVYENGVFKPTEPVNLPEHCRVKVEPESFASNESCDSLVQTEIHDILAERYDSGDPYGAERHNEHQP